MKATEFTCPIGHLFWVRLPLGLEEIANLRCPVCGDKDLIVYAKTMEVREHVAGNTGSDR